MATVKIKDVAKRYRFDARDFELFCSRSKHINVQGLLLDSIDEKDVENAVVRYQRYLEKRKQEQKEKEEAINQVLVTTCSSLEGYTILGYGDIVMGCAYGMADHGVIDEISLRSEAIKNICEAALESGANAVIGFHFDADIVDIGGLSFNSSTLGSQTTDTRKNSYVNMVAYGTAVLIERNVPHDNENEAMSDDFDAIISDAIQ